MEDEITRQQLTDEESGMDDGSDNPLEQMPQDGPAAAPEVDSSITEAKGGSVVTGEKEAGTEGGRPRSLKLVLTLQPEGTEGYQAMLALGAEGCDPILRSVAVAGIAEAVDQIPALVAEAEDRWQLQPRYPATAAAKAPAAAPSGRAPKVPQAPARAEDQTAPKPVQGAAAADQLPLFG